MIKKYLFYKHLIISFLRKYIRQNETKELVGV